MERSELETTVRAAQAGDAASVGRLVDAFARTVLGTAYGLCGDWDRARDVAQETFAVAIARLRDLREPLAFPGWIVAIARSVAARARRHERAPGPETAEAGSPAPGPEDVAAERSEAHRVRLAVEALPAAERLPVVLHYFAGHALAEISVLCDVPVSTVKKRMRDARARLRAGADDLAGEMLRRLEPPEAGPMTDEIRVHAAVRSGDLARVEALLRDRPELVDVRERWTAEESVAHRLPFVVPGAGTPLLRAIERGDAALATLLLDHGADPDGGCACPGGERPLWTAVVHRRAEIARELLARGADPNATAFQQTTPLHVAAMRGYDELVDLLRAHGADPEARDAGGRTPRDWAADAHPRVIDRLGSTRPGALCTGIRALDLWSPLPARGLVRWTAGPWLGSTVLLAELSWRVASLGGPVVWTGFSQAPTDVGDVRHGLAELGVTDRVTLSLASHRASRDEQLATFEEGISAMERLRPSDPEAGSPALLVIFEETGWASEIGLRIARLAKLPCTTLVVAPIHPEEAPVRPGAGPWQASVAFSRERARRQLWPAVGPDGSWSRVQDPEGARLAARARAVLQMGGAKAEALEIHLAQPFRTAEPFSGRRGEWVSLEELRAALAPLLAAADAGGFARRGRRLLPLADG